MTYSNDPATRAHQIYEDAHTAMGGDLIGKVARQRLIDEHIIIEPVTVGTLDTLAQSMAAIIGKAGIEASAYEAYRNLLGLDRDTTN